MSNLNHLLVIEKFYFSFAGADITGMQKCYHPEIIFQDPVFGKLNGPDAIDMWNMLIEKSRGELDIRFSKLKASGNHGSAEWKANYMFSTTNREVKNQIHADFEFKDGLIFRHIDTFDLYRWSKQALGLKGFIFGWTPLFRKQIRQKALHSLHLYQQTKTSIPFN